MAETKGPEPTKYDYYAGAMLDDMGLASQVKSPEVQLEACKPVGNIELRFQELEATAANVNTSVKIITKKLNGVMEPLTAETEKPPPPDPVLPECAVAGRLKDVSDQLRITADAINDIMERIEL